MKKNRIAFLLVILFMSSYKAVFSENLDINFNSAANWGGTGLLEIPNARTLSYGEYRVGVTQVEPYRYYFGALSPYKGLELQGTVTEILDTKVEDKSNVWSNYGNYKDKAAGLKYKITEEGKWLPSIAVGVYDPHGTRLYASQYVVASKQIYPFDFTLGFGNGRFGKRPLESISEEAGGGTIKIEMLTDPKKWLDEGQFFYGIQFSPTKNFSLMAEYAPIKYESLREPAVKYYKNGVKSNVNYAIRYSPYDWVDIKGSFQRGEELGVQVSFKFNIGEPMIPIYHKPYIESDEMRLKPLEKRVIYALSQIGFIDISVDITKYAIFLELENNRYFYIEDAIENLLETLHKILPDNIEYFNILFTKNRIPSFRIELERSTFDDYINERIDYDTFYNLSKFDLDVVKVSFGHKTASNRFIYGLKPSFGAFLNDPSGFFKYRIGLKGWIGYKFTTGGTFVTSLETFPINNISSINQPLSIPVRSDIVDFKDNKIWLGSMMIDKIDKYSGNLYTRYSFGILETQFAGIDMEVAKPFLGGRVLLGLNSSIVKKRDSENFFRLKDNPQKEYYKTLFFNTRFNFPTNEVAIDLQNGYFLAGDKGTKITISKTIKGVVLSAWYSYTNTDVFKDNINRNYHDKGIAVSIPLRIFKGADSKTSYSFALSPWTRDVAQDIAHYNPLFNYIGRDLKIFVDKMSNKN